VNKSVFSAALNESTVWQWERYRSTPVWYWPVCLCERRVCTASVDGHLCVWDSDSVLRLSRIQLDIDDRSLSSLVHHQHTLLCCKPSSANISLRSRLSVLWVLLSPFSSTSLLHHCQQSCLCRPLSESLVSGHLFTMRHCLDQQFYQNNAMVHHIVVCPQNTFFCCHFTP